MQADGTVKYRTRRTVGPNMLRLQSGMQYEQQFLLPVVYGSLNEDS